MESTDKRPPKISNRQKKDKQRDKFDEYVAARSSNSETVESSTNIQPIKIQPSIMPEKEIVFTTNPETKNININIPSTTPLYEEINAIKSLLEKSPNIVETLDNLLDLLKSNLSNVNLRTKAISFNLVLRSVLADLKQYKSNPISTDYANKVIGSIYAYLRACSMYEDNQSTMKILENLFKFSFHDSPSSTTRKVILPVFSMFFDFVENNNSYVNFMSSTGSGKTRCIPFMIAIKTIEEGLTHPFIIMVQPSVAIIDENFKSFLTENFDGEVNVTFNTKYLINQYEQYKNGRKPTKPIFAILSSRKALNLLYNHTDLNILDSTRFILDEVHERTVYTDVLIAYLSKHSQKFSLRVLMMSATPDKRIFECFDDKVQELSLFDAELFEIRDKNFVVEQNSVITKVIDCVFEELKKKNGRSILIFTSGNQRIKSMKEEFQTRLNTAKDIVLISNIDDIVNSDSFTSSIEEMVQDDSKTYVIQLTYTSYMSEKEKNLAKSKIPERKNLIKLIFSTNALETSITISDLGCVIDCCVENVPKFDPNTQIKTLKEKPITKQSQVQRRGRVGRTCPGTYVSVMSEGMVLPEYQDPEILTTDINQAILDLRLINVNLETVENLPNKIPNIMENIKSLIDSEILDNNYQLTDHGRKITQLSPLPPFIATAIIHTSERPEFKNDPSLCIILCCLTMLITTNDLIIDLNAIELCNSFDKESDFVTMLNALFKFMKTPGSYESKVEQFGFNLQRIKTLIGTVKQIAKNINANLDKNWKNLNDFYSNCEFKQKLSQIMFNELQSINQEWIDYRKVIFDQIENPKHKIMIYKHKSRDTRITFYQRPGAISLDMPHSAYIISITKNVNTEHGSLIHINRDEKDGDHPTSLVFHNYYENPYIQLLLKEYLTNIDRYIRKYDENNYFYFVKSSNKDFTMNFIIKDSLDGFRILGEAINVIETLLPYIPSSVAIPSRKYDCFVLMNSFEQVSAHACKDIKNVYDIGDSKDLIAYKISQNVINYLHQHVNDITNIEKKLYLAISGEQLSFSLDNIKGGSKQIIPKIATKYAFDEIDATNLFVISDSVIPGSTPLKWFNPKHQIKAENADNQSNINRSLTQMNEHYLLILHDSKNFNINKIEEIKKLKPSDNVKFYNNCIKKAKGTKIEELFKIKGFYDKRSLGLLRGDDKDINSIKTRIAMREAMDEQAWFENIFGDGVITIRFKTRDSMNDFIAKIEDTDKKWGGKVKLEMIEMQLDQHQILNDSINDLKKFVNLVVEKLGIKLFSSEVKQNRLIVKIIGHDKAQAFLNEINNIYNITQFFVPNDLYPEALQKNEAFIQSIIDWAKSMKIVIKRNKFKLYVPPNDENRLFNAFYNSPPNIPFIPRHLPENAVYGQIAKQLKIINAASTPEKAWIMSNINDRTVYVPKAVTDEEFNDVILKASGQDPDDFVLLYDEIGCHGKEGKFSNAIIPIFQKNGDVDFHNYCVLCVKDFLTYHLQNHGMLDNNGKVNVNAALNCNAIIETISFVEKKIDPELHKYFPIIPFGHLLTSFVSEKDISQLVKCLITQISQRELISSPLFTFCPDHPEKRFPRKDGSCCEKCGKMYCLLCKKWHLPNKCTLSERPPGYRLCPNCHCTFVKLDGCNHITCNCGAHWCYYCEAGPYRYGREVYDHMQQMHPNYMINPPDHRKYISHERISDFTLEAFYKEYPHLRPR